MTQRDGRSAQATSTRRHAFPGREQVRQFAIAVRTPRRGSAVRACFDGVRVVLILKRRGLAPLLGAAGGGRVDSAEAGRISDAVDAGLALLPARPTCLRRSVTLLRELQRCGLFGALRIGVRSVDGHVEAHAWVEVDDQVINDDIDVVRTYSPLGVNVAASLPGLS